MFDISQLNEKQKEFVLSPDGPHMVLAGAGSGKTKALTTKIAYLIKEKKVLPWEILAVTFTNKAASEMKNRVLKIIDVPENQINIFTFHSLCVRILRMEKEFVKLGNFSIYDDSDAKTVVKKILKEEGVTDVPPAMILQYIDYLKNNGYSTINKRNENIEINKDLHFYYEEYEKELQKNNAIDFGGIITKVIELFDSYPEVLKKYQNKYKHFLVDEYQDTNRAQFYLCNLLAEKHKNLYIVLDLDQSIYSFRSANIHNTLDFEKIYPDYKLIKLEENYRSTKKILAGANSVISHNNQRKDKRLYTQNPEGESIKILRCNNQLVEATAVAGWAKGLLKKSVEPNEIAIFFRNNSLSRSVEDALRREKVNYIIYGGMKFYDRKEIKDLISYLKVIVNPSDNVALQRSLNVPSRAFGATTIKKLEDESKKTGKSIFKILESGSCLSKKQKDSAKEYVDVINEIRAMDIKKDSLKDIFLYLIKHSGYEDMLKKSTAIEDQSRLDNVKEFLNTFIEYDKKGVSLLEALEGMSLYSDTEETAKEDCVILMTIHASKGLEFDNVFVVGNEENIFPSIRSINSPDQDNGGVEEERRLFYVAMTRARVELYLSFCYERMSFGQKQYNEASRFIIEIPDTVRSLIDLRS